MKIAITPIRAIVISIIALAFVIAATSLPALAGSGTTSSTSEVPEFELTWGSNGAGDGELNRPYDMAIDSHDNLYVADGFNNRVQKFDSSGSFLMKWGTAGTGDGELNTPVGITIDNNDAIFVTDVGNHRIQKFDSDGNFITKWGVNGTGDGEFNSPHGISTDNSGNVYVADTLNNRIQKFDSDGNFITNWGVSGTDDGEFNVPYSLVVDNGGDLYVTEGGNRVQKFDSDGNFITKWGVSGSSNGEFTTPFGITYSQDFIYVSDAGNYRIQKFDTDGNYIAKWGTRGTGDGEFDNSYGIVVNNVSNIYVSGAINHRIQKFTFPQNLSSLTTDSGANVNLTLPEGANLTQNETLAVSDGADTDYIYPLDMVNFTFETVGDTVGATTEVTLVFETELTPSDVVARKYNSTTDQYSTIADAVITETTLNGSPALQLTYDITDGGELDEDGTANGIVVDPVGLGVEAAETDSGTDSETPGAPDTGHAPTTTLNPIIVVGSIASVSAAASIVWRVRK